MLKKLPKVEIVGHYHDGNTFAIPNKEVDEVIKYYNKQVKVFGEKAKLTYPQVMEVKDIFRPKLFIKGLVCDALAIAVLNLKGVIYALA